MSIFDVFNSYNLTQSQEELLSQLDAFFEGDEFCFLLKGYAGTGKTFMMKGVADYLKQINWHCIIAAPTGRAAKVISQKTGYPAYTIHKTIYKNTDLKEYKVLDEDGTETYKFFFALDLNSDPANTVYIVDEASMISNHYAEAEFFRFGSGYLLKDLFEYVNRNNDIYRKKIIFIGDNAQLPPVNMNTSPALDRDYLHKEFSIKPIEFELTHVHRQEIGSGILENATMLRNNLRDGNFGKLVFNMDFNDINAVNEPDFLDAYLQAANKKINTDIIVIAYSNKVVKAYNDLIRAHFFPNKEKQICVGDRVAIQANNYNYEIKILNGDFGIIRQVFPTSITRKIPLKNKDKQGNVTEIMISLTFRKVVIEIEDTDNKAHLIECMIVENLLYSDNKDLTSEEARAIYIDFWIRHPKLNRIKTLLQAKSIENKSKELETIFGSIQAGDINDKLLAKIKNIQKRYFKGNNSKYIVETSIYILKEAFKTDEYSNALKVKFGYAITCHKAQGGEWDKVFVNCKTSMDYLNSTYFRWLYTGITRTKNNLLLLNPPNIQIEMTSTIMDIKKENMENITQNISVLISNLINPLDIKIETISEIQSGFNLSFSKGQENAKATIYYKKEKISSINPNGKSSDLQSEIIANLEKLKGSSINVTSHDEKESIAKPTFSESFLEDFYKRICSKVIAEGITVNIEMEKKHLLRYKFTKKDKAAYIDFHYTGTKQFKKYTPQISMSDRDFLNVVCKQIGNL